MRCYYYYILFFCLSLLTFESCNDVAHYGLWPWLNSDFFILSFFQLFVCYVSEHTCQHEVSFSQCLVRESTESWPRLWPLFFGGAICAYAYRPDNTQCSFNIDTYLSNESCNSTDRQISSIVWYFLLDPIHSTFIIGYFLLFSNRLTPIKPPSDNTFCLSGRVRS